MSEATPTVEATGETVGEAKWAALRELELRHPGLDKAAVRFEVVSEGERGLLGVGLRAGACDRACAGRALPERGARATRASSRRRRAAARSAILDALGVDGRSRSTRTTSASPSPARRATSRC